MENPAADKHSERAKFTERAVLATAIATLIGYGVLAWAILKKDRDSTKPAVKW